MLYDQGQLASIYAIMFQITKSEVLLEATRDICDYVLKNLHHPDGSVLSTFV